MGGDVGDAALVEEVGTVFVVLKGVLQLFEEILFFIGELVRLLP